MLNRLVEQQNGIPGLGRVPVPKYRSTPWDTLLFVAAVFMGLWVGTQFVAWRLHYGVDYVRHVGPVFGGHTEFLPRSVPDRTAHVYAPWDGLVWWRELDGGERYHALSKSEQQAITHVFTLFMLVSGVAFAITLLTLRPLVSKQRVPQVLADDEFANDKEIREWGYTGGDGFVIGQRVMRDKGVARRELIRANGEGHVLFAMGTGAGKDRGPITTTLLDDASANHCFVIHDPPGETGLRVAGARREELGNYVFRCAWGMDRDKHPWVAPWNAFAEIPRGDKRDTMIASLLAHKHVDRDGSGIRGKNRYFYEGGINIAALAAMITCYASQTPQYGVRCSGAGVLDLVNQVAMEGDGLAGLVDFALNFDHTCGGRYQWIGPDGRPSGKHPGIVRLAGLVSQIKGEESQAVIATFQNGFSMYAMPIIAENTETSAFSVRRLMDYDRPTTTILSADVGDEDTLMPLHVLFYELLFAFNQSSEHLTRIDGGQTACTHLHELYVVLNEKYSMPKIRGIEKGATTARKFQIHIVPFYQTPTQPTQQYGENNSIEPLMALKVYSAAGETAAQEKISKYAGSHTIGYDTSSLSPDGKLSYQLHLNSAPLLKQSHVGRMSNDYRLAVPLNRKPFVVEAVRYDDYPELRRRADIPPPPFSDRLPLWDEAPADEVTQARAVRDLREFLEDVIDTHTEGDAA